MGFYKYLRNAQRNPTEELEAFQTERMIKWRKQASTIRLERPTRLDRARSLGYKAKQGFLIVLQRVVRGGRMREKIRAGRKPKHFRQQKILAKNYQLVAEERAQRKYPNCQVLNSYEAGRDGQHYWYEVILLDSASPSVIADKDSGWIAMAQHKGRAARGLTSAGRRGRGLLHKGVGAEHLRPSLRANRR